MVAIRKLSALEILDSRGYPTLKVFIELEDHTHAEAAVPSGASTGEHESCELRDNDPNRFSGKGVLKAKANVDGPLHELLKGVSVLEQEKIDRMMIEADGTKNKSSFGANAILGVSLAVAKAAALVRKQPLYESIRQQKSYILPCPMNNIINGGMHADNNIDFQEFMIRSVGASTLQEAVRWASEIFHTLKALLKKAGHTTSVGDEGGFAPNLRSAEEALDMILEAIAQAGYKPKEQIAISIDCAASSFYDKKTRRYVEKKSKEKKTYTSEQMVDYLESLCDRYPIDTIEDGLDENDWEGWVYLTERLGKKVQIIGDDIFVTNKVFLQKGIDMGVANSILIKLNQIGTLTETLETIDLAHESGYTTVISHRSGETEDTTIADLAVAVNAGQIKTGSLCRSERIAKYNRLIEIEHELGTQGSFFDSNPCAYAK